MAKDLKKKINKLNKKVEELLSNHKKHSDSKDKGIYDKIVGYLSRFESEHHLFEALEDALDKQAKSLAITSLDEVVEKPRKSAVKNILVKKASVVAPTQTKKVPALNAAPAKKTAVTKPIAKISIPKK